MLGVITGFAIILSVIFVGYLLGKARVFAGDQERLALNRVAFFAATPALIFTVVAESNPEELFSPVIGVSVLAIAGTAAIYVALSRVFFPRDLATTATGAASASYVNSNNIGLPVSMYVIGTGAYVAPILVIQMVVLTPILLAMLDRGKTWQAIRNALFSPLVVMSALGLVVCLTGWTVPEPVMAPLKILGGASIPMILMSFGASLTTQKMLDTPSERPVIVTSTVVKLVVMPALATAIGWVAGLRDDALYAAVILAALPTAQNVYNYAATYQRGTIVARDTVFLTTFLALPIMLVIALLFGR